MKSKNKFSIIEIINVKSDLQTRKITKDKYVRLNCFG